MLRGDLQVVSKISFQTMVFARNFGQKKAKISSFENSGFDGFNVEFGLLIFCSFAAENRIGWKIAPSFNLRLNMEMIHFRCPVRRMDYLALEKVCAMLVRFLCFCHLNYKVF